MIGSNILNKLVLENGITQPDLILNNLNEEIRTALKQKENSSETRDGMDILMISIDGYTLEYAGAQRPLWLISDNKLTETKADKFAIGGIQQEQKRVFTKHVLTLQKNDTLYLSTDGFADQFGGESGKKLMTKNFKELLLGVQNKPMSEQKEFLRTTIEKWKGSREQIDDILVIGIKI
jgi:serine phosphatase RsbU (regulator of sigma subunit)